ncbi:hypothetical protein BY996DRAFT_6513868 [Phakopsora pachyrhizi]|nr:hypothetical protein BY996DRAFT_6513868 [Phakopsora pachyrhizi]
MKEEKEGYQPVSIENKSLHVMVLWVDRATKDGKNKKKKLFDGESHSKAMKLEKWWLLSRALKNEMIGWLGGNWIGTISKLKRDEREERGWDHRTYRPYRQMNGWMGLWTLDLFKKEDDQANAVEGLMLPPANAMIKPFKTAKTYNLEEMIKTRQSANSQVDYLKRLTEQVKIWDYLCRYGYGQRIDEGFKGLEQDKDSTRITGQKSRGYRIKGAENSVVRINNNKRGALV